MSAQLRIRESTSGRTTTLVLSGELGLAGAPELEAAVRRLCYEPVRQLLLDLSEVSFVDTIGVRTLVTCKELFEQTDCGYWVLPPRAGARRVLERYGLLEEIPLRDHAAPPR